MHWTNRVLGLIVIVVSACTSGVGAEDRGVSADFEAKLQTATNSCEAGTFYMQFLARAPRNRLQQLKHNRDSAIALHAAWHLHNVEIPRDDTGLNPPIVDPQQGARFIGFLEGRTSLTPPKWWQETLLDSHFGGKKKATSEAANYTDVSPKRKWGEFLWLPPRTSLRIKGEVVKARVGDQLVEFPALLLRQSEKEEWARCIIDIGEHVTLIAFYGNHLANRYPIVCVDSKSGKVKWRAESWGTGDENLSLPGSGGEGHHYVELKRDGNCLAILGNAPFGAYVEVFDMRTGNCRLRFSTNYWNADSRPRCRPPGNKKEGSTR